MATCSTYVKQWLTNTNCNTFVWTNRNLAFGFDGLVQCETPLLGDEKRW